MEKLRGKQTLDETGEGWKAGGTSKLIIFVLSKHIANMQNFIHN